MLRFEEFSQSKMVHPHLRDLPIAKYIPGNIFQFASRQAIGVSGGYRGSAGKIDRLGIGIHGGHAAFSWRSSSRFQRVDISLIAVSCSWFSSWSSFFQSAAWSEAGSGSEFGNLYRIFFTTN